MTAIELTMPLKDRFLNFKGNTKVREEYVKWMTETLKNKYQKAIENSEWEIVLIVQIKIIGEGRDVEIKKQLIW